MSEPFLINKAAAITGRVEIVRSFSYKLNAGNYESRDFFCSQRAECDAGDASEVSSKLYEFCKRQVLLAVQQYVRDNAAIQRQIHNTTEAQRRTA